MLLVIDVGNTNIVLGVFEGKALKHSWRASTSKDRTVDEYGVLCHNLFELHGISASDVRSIVIGSVVPPLNERLVLLARNYFHLQPVFVEAAEQDIMPVLYKSPGKWVRTVSSTLSPHTI